MKYVGCSDNRRAGGYLNLNEEVWEWRVEGENPLDDSYFNVYFSLDEGRVKKSGLRIGAQGVTPPGLRPHRGGPVT